MRDILGIKKRKRMRSKHKKYVPPPQEWGPVYSNQGKVISWGPKLKSIDLSAFNFSNLSWADLHVMGETIREDFRQLQEIHRQHNSNN